MDNDGNQVNQLNEEEQRLGVLIDAGRSLAQVLSDEGRDPSVMEKRTLRNAKRAEDELFEANLGLAYWHAQRYPANRTPVEDLRQAAAIGLLRAVRRFKPGGAPLSVYARQFIRSELRKCVIQHTQPLGVPDDAFTLRGKARQKAEELSVELGRDVTAEELAEAMGLAVDHPAIVGPVVGSLPEAFDPVSDGVDVAELIEDKDLRERFRVLLTDVLSERELEVVSLRYGLETGSQMDLSAIGEKVGISREYSRQMLSTALAKLRHPACRLMGEVAA